MWFLIKCDFQKHDVSNTWQFRTFWFPKHNKIHELQIRKTNATSQTTAGHQGRTAYQHNSFADCSSYSTRPQLDFEPDLPTTEKLTSETVKSVWFPEQLSARHWGNLRVDPPPLFVSLFMGREGRGSTLIIVHPTLIHSFQLLLHCSLHLSKTEQNTPTHSLNGSVRHEPFAISSPLIISSPFPWTWFR